MSPLPCPTIPDPFPPDLSLRHFPRIWISADLLVSGPWLRMRRETPGLTDNLLLLHAAAQARPGCGLEDCSETFAHICGIDLDEWMETWDAPVRRQLVRDKSGRMYVRLLLPDAIKTFEAHQKNQARPKAARAAKAAKAAQKAAAEASPAEPKKSKPRKALAENPPAVSVTVSSRVDTPSLSPPPHAREAEAKSRDPAHDAEAVGVAEVAERIIALFPAWPRPKARRAAEEREARRLLAEALQNPKYADGRLILEEIHRQSRYLRERNGPHLGPWLVGERYKPFEERRKPPIRKGQKGSRGQQGAAVQTPPGAGSSDADWLEWAVAKVAAEVAAGKPLQEVISRARTLAFWWPQTAPQGLQGRLADALEQRTGFRLTGYRAGGQ